MGKMRFIGLLCLCGSIMVITDGLMILPQLDDESLNDKERMICNVIVRAVHDLHVYQKKSVQEINVYLDADCKKLVDEDLVDQCHEMVTENGAQIYEYVKNGIEMSQICQKISDFNEIDLPYSDDDENNYDGKTQCSRQGKDKCQCCKIHVFKRKMRLRQIVKQIARKHLRMCRKSRRALRCRFWVRERERHFLKKIEKICPCTICTHLGYCKKRTEGNNLSNVDLFANQSSLLLEMLLDQQLDIFFSKNICSNFELLQTSCVQIAASVDSRHYGKVHMAMLRDDITWIEKDLQKTIQSINADTNTKPCSTCKDTVQLSTNFYTKNLGLVRDTLMNICGQWSSKEDCQDVLDKQFDDVKNYLHTLKADKICAVKHHCTMNVNDKCAACVQRFQPRKDTAKKLVDHFASYLPTLCTKAAASQCLQFVSEVTAELRSFIDDFDVQNACLAMGFCDGNTAQDLDTYERAYVEVMKNDVCSMLEPYEKLCEKVIQGDNLDTEEISFIAKSMEEFSLRCESSPDEIVSSVVDASEEKDKCQCCINRVIQKKKIIKERIAKYVEHMKELCKRCPAREKCERHWDEKKARWDGKIDKICPKRACIHMGYCTNTHPFGQSLPFRIGTTILQPETEKKKTMV
ncbi:unnamed protein product [Adineta ricciae]|uniref:Uncharacterized protein n=1 Tax=Adineta ricciae TaxID=249248 RepID=A0A815MWJ5_ADIRI|nr:unnamed protein product [Adineta ricciae]